MGLDNHLVADTDGTRLNDGIRTLNADGREPARWAMGDTRRLAGIDVVVTGCIIKGRHCHDRRPAGYKAASAAAGPASAWTDAVARAD